MKLRTYTHFLKENQDPKMLNLNKCNRISRAEGDIKLNNI